MDTKDPSPAVFTPPKISTAKVLKRIEDLKLRSYDVADRLNITPAAVTRGLRSQKWLNAKISDLSVILEVHETELFADSEDQNWMSPIERACGKPGKDGYLLPAGTTIRPMMVQNKWELMLVSPPSVPSASGDLVLVTAKGEKAAIEIKCVGRMYPDKADDSRWIISTGPDRTPESIQKSKVISIQVVITNLGNKAWGKMSKDSYTKIPDPEHQDILDRIGNDAPVTVFRLKDGNDPETGKPYRGKKFMVSVWDTTTRKSKKKTKSTVNDVVEYARETWSAFSKGTDSAGRVGTQVVLDLLVAEMRDNDREEQTIHDLSAPILAGIAAGLTDLKDPLIGAKVKHFLDEVYKPNCGFGPRKLRSNRQQLKLIGYWRQLAKYAMQTIPRPMLTMNPFLGVKPKKGRKTVKKPMEVIPIDHCYKLVTDEALARREGLLWAFRLYTSTRASEGNWVRWSHIDFALKRMFIVGEPDGMDIAEAAALDDEGKRVKFDKYRTCRLPDELIEILRPLKPEMGDCYLFSESIRTRAANNEGKAMRHHMRACGIPADVVAPITPHDTRSTSACIWRNLIDEDRLMAHLGHDDPIVTRTYTKRAYDFEVPLAGWTDGQWHLRNPCSNVSRVSTGAAKPIFQEPIEAAGVLPAASDIADDWFIVLPDYKGLTTEDDSESDDDSTPCGALG